MRYVLPALLALALLGGCGSSKRTSLRYDRAKLTSCLRGGGYSFARAGGGVVRLDVKGETRFGTLAEIDVAFGRNGADALARLRAHYFFKTNPKAKLFVHGRYAGNVAYAITTLPFSKKGLPGLPAARARVRARAERLVARCLTRSRA